MFGEKGKFIISGGNDKSVKVWDWMKSHDGGQTSNGSSDIVCSSITLSRKVSYTFLIWYTSFCPTLTSTLLHYGIFMMVSLSD